MDQAATIFSGATLPITPVAAVRVVWIAVRPSSAITLAASAGSSVSTVASTEPRSRSSALVPWATSRPTCMTPTWVHIWSTSESRWLETSTVAPSSASDPTSWRTSRVPCGSSPLVGSSRTSRSFGVSSAAAIASRCRMPREYAR